MNIFQKVWQSLDGNKTLIGTIAFAICAKLEPSYPSIDWPFWEYFIGILTGVVGGGHKILKNIPNEKLPDGFKTRLDPRAKPIEEATVSEAVPYSPKEEGGN